MPCRSGSPHGVRGADWPDTPPPVNATTATAAIADASTPADLTCRLMKTCLSCHSTLLRAPRAPVEGELVEGWTSAPMIRHTVAIDVGFYSRAIVTAHFPLDHYAAQNENLFPLCPPAQRSRGARSAPEDTANQARALPGYQGRSPAEPLSGWLT